jgi:hypothetical protein
MTWLQKLREAAQKATKGPWSWREGSLKGPYRDAQADHYGNNVVTVTYAAQCPHLVVKEADAAHIARFDPPTVALLLDVVEAAWPELQDTLDSFAHGLVEDWSPELEREIGWGEDCNAYKLWRALHRLRAHVTGASGGGDE